MEHAWTQQDRDAAWKIGRRELQSPAVDRLPPHSTEVMQADPHCLAMQSGISVGVLAGVELAMRAHARALEMVGSSLSDPERVVAMAQALILAELGPMPDAPDLPKPPANTVWSCGRMIHVSVVPEAAKLLSGYLESAVPRPTGATMAATERLRALLVEYGVAADRDARASHLPRFEARPVGWMSADELARIVWYIGHSGPGEATTRDMVTEAATRRLALMKRLQTPDMEGAPEPAGEDGPVVCVTVTQAQWDDGIVSLQNTLPPIRTSTGENWPVMDRLKQMIGLQNTSASRVKLSLSAPFGRWIYDSITVSWSGQHHHAARRRLKTTLREALETAGALRPQREDD